MDENKDKKTLSGKLQLKKTINAGQIKQSFSHGRSRSVSVEVKKKRTISGFSKNEIAKQPKSDGAMIFDGQESSKKDDQPLETRVIKEKEILQTKSKRGI